MEITTDIYLKGTSWIDAIEGYKTIFKRTNYDLYILSMAIGIREDKTEWFGKIDQDKSYPSVPRNVIQNNDNGKIEIMFQAAILSSSTVEFDEDKRLLYAFGEAEPNDKFSKLDFLMGFANYGITQIEKTVGQTPLETIENLKNYLDGLVNNKCPLEFEIGDLSIDDVK